MIVKPKYLYHGSQNRKIKLFTPQAKRIRNPEEGPVIFATTSPRNAAPFIIPSDDSWSDLGAYNGVRYATYNSKDRLNKVDKGGSIYKLPSKTFSKELKYGGGKDEWTSREPVKPVAQKEYDSGLEAMLSLGVQVYFVDNDLLKSIKSSEDHGFKIMQKQTSENMKRNLNVIRF